jgi:pro-kumamolisin-like protein
MNQLEKSCGAAVRRGMYAVLCSAILLFVVEGPAQAQSLLTRHAREVTLNGQAQSVGRLPATQSMRFVLVLPLRNQAELDDFLKNLYDPSSASFHQFLTVEEFTTMFGPSKEDYDAVIHFAETNGFSVVGTSRNRMNVDIMGTVETIEKAFHLNMGVYQHPTEGRTFYAPDREPTPNLSVRLWHIAGLDNYSIPHPAGLHRNLSVKSNATTGSGPSASFLGSDMRAAYYGGAALNGSGQSLGLLEYYGTDLSDLTTYFHNAGQTNSVPITLYSTDGTSTSCVYPVCDDTEQTLDITQALGMAPGLSSLVMYVGSSDAAIFNAMATAVPLNAQLSSSWAWTPADPSTDDPYFQEFAAQGQSLFQAAGDSGRWTSSQIYVYPADDVYVTSVGGTDLTTSSAGGPWSSETAWVNGGGGISTHNYAIPSWQTRAASGCPSCSQIYRNGPDVSANSNFTFYVCADKTCTANNYGGTSFAAPMWAGYLALVNQQSVANGNKTLGFINPAIYQLGLGSGYGTDFHDITSGSNGYSATTGYDLATGWGSPNGTGLINALATTSTTANFTISASPTSVSVVQGSNGTSTITTAISGSFNSTVTLSATGQPTGVTVSFSPTSIAAPGSGSSTMTMTVASTTATGTYPITVTGTGGGITHTTTVNLTVNAAAQPNYSLSASPASVTITQGTNGSSTITVNGQNGFNGSVSLSAAGMPNGVTASLNPSSTTTTSTLTLTASGTATTGRATVTITGTSGSLTHTTTVSLTVNTAAQPNYSLSASPASVAITQGTSGSSTITVNRQNGFNGSVSLSASGMPNGVTASLNPSSTTSTSTLTLTASSTAATGTSIVTITGTSGGLSHTTTVSLTVNAAGQQNYSLSASPNSLSVARGSTGTSTITINPTNGFTGSVTFSASNLPTGVTASFSLNPSTSNSTVTLTVSSSATTGTFSVRVRGRSGGLSHSVRITLTVQ